MKAVRKRKSAKKEAWDWCSKYIRLRDAIEYNKKHPDEAFGFVKCCTCPQVVVWDKNCDAGHFIGRGLGGMSGVYFDERNIHAQCKRCNAFEGGRQLEYLAFMRDRYGQQVVDELKFLHNNRSYKRKIVGIGLMYKQMYKNLKGD